MMEGGVRHARPGRDRGEGNGTPRVFKRPQVALAPMASPLFPLAALGLGILIGLFGSRLWSRPRLPFTAEDCVAAADRALGEERWPEAAEWLERARRLAPRSARIHLDLAFALRQCGQPEEALRLAEEARSLGASEAETQELEALLGGPDPRH